MGTVGVVGPVRWPWYCVFPGMVGRVVVHERTVCRESWVNGMLTLGDLRTTVIFEVGVRTLGNCTGGVLPNVGSTERGVFSHSVVILGSIE